MSRTALRLVPPVTLPVEDLADEPLEGEPLEGEPLEGDRYLTVPVPRGSGAGQGLPWQGDGDVAWVPAVLLLAASGRCSCDDCCEALVRAQRRGALTPV